MFLWTIKTPHILALYTRYVGHAMPQVGPNVFQC